MPALLPFWDPRTVPLSGAGDRYKAFDITDEFVVDYGMDRAARHGYLKGTCKRIPADPEPCGAR